MRAVPGTEAKTHVAPLPSAMEPGEAVAIARHGRPIAHRVLAEAQERAVRRAAVERFGAQCAGWKGAGLSSGAIPAARHEGYRYRVLSCSMRRSR
ncbi:MAG: hypothetical protein OXD35_13550 [Thiotrichales bacterium]|nr:hypothetical protein [Thiotrichales bacterium]